MSRPSCHIWKSTLRARSRFDGLSCAAPQRLLSSTFRTTPGRKPDVFRRAAGRHPAVSRTSCGRQLSPNCEHGAVMNEDESITTEITRRAVIETGTTALLLTTLPRAALGAGPLDET